MHYNDILIWAIVCTSFVIVILIAVALTRRSERRKWLPASVLMRNKRWYPKQYIGRLPFHNVAHRNPLFAPNPSPEDYMFYQDFVDDVINQADPNFTLDNLTYERRRRGRR